MSEFLNHFREQPGLYFVVATLLPLASFVVLILGGALRLFLRSRKNESAALLSLYRVFGGDVPGRMAAYIATGAIGLAFVLCVVGAVPFWHDQEKRHHLEGEIHALLKAEEQHEISYQDEPSHQHKE